MQKIKELIERVKGFTLIELLVVIAIIGILSSSVVVSTNEARKSARDVRRLEDLKQIANAMEIYLDSNNRLFPDSLNALVPTYIAVLPKDPLTKADYFYCSNGTAGGANDGTTFHLGAAMEKYNPTFFNSDADLEQDGCENLAGNSSFNGYSESCSESQKCSGENCDGCLDFTNIATIGNVGDGDGNGGGNNGGGDQGGGNGGGNQCNMLVPNTDGAAQTLGVDWVTSAAGNDTNWHSVAYGNNLFVAVGYGGASRVMTSPDGVNWTTRDAGGNDDRWYGVTYGNGLFVAVGNTTNSKVMTSPDGIHWTVRDIGDDAGSWYAVTYGNGTFVAVGNGGNKIMRSPDGINWTISTTVGATGDLWSVVYGNGLFVAVGSSGSKRIITSPDGINWTPRSATGDNDWWSAVTYGNGVFVAVGAGADYIITSVDGINWTSRMAPANNYTRWIDVAYGNGLFTAVGYSNHYDRIMTSPDGVNWTERDAGGINDEWYSITFGNGIFVTVGNFGNRLMTSGKPEYIYKSCP